MEYLFLIYGAENRLRWRVHFWNFRLILPNFMVCKCLPFIEPAVFGAISNGNAVPELGYVPGNCLVETPMSRDWL